MQTTASIENIVRICHHRTMKVLIVLTLVCWGSPANAEDVSDILNRFVVAQRANDGEARRYTYVEHADFFTYEDGGKKLRKDRSEENEIIFVEGLQFKKLISRNDQPLSAREQADVEKHMQETAEYRRRHRQQTPGGRISFGRDHVDLGSNEDLLSLFDSRLVGEDEIRGHKAWVVELTPKAGLRPANEHEREVVKFRKKLWIEQMDYTALKVIHTVVESGMFAKPGTTVTLEYERIPGGPYLAAFVAVDIHRQVGKEILPSGRTEYRNTRFQKFDVQSSITIDKPQ